MTGSLMPALLMVLTAVTAAAVAVGRIVYLLHMLQLEEYDLRRFSSWLLTHLRRLAANPMLDLLASMGIAGLILPAQSMGRLTAACCMSIVAGIAALLWERRLMLRSPVKKPLVMTARARRLLGCSAVLAAAVSFASLAVSMGSHGLAVVLLVPAVAPLILIAGRMIMEPVEALIRGWYVRDARKTMSQLAPIVIGITGSYGKTSTKFITEHLLRSRYRVLMTPESYNTAMGICRVIREQLGPEHEVFIVELAENERGGFEYLLSLVPCSVSVVTSVGMQHLEEFGSKEAIERVMTGFVKMPASGSTVILNGDDTILRGLAMTSGKQILTVSGSGSSSSDLHAERVTMGTEGLSFDIVTIQGERYTCHTALLGRHNVENILLAVAVARQLGVSWNDILDSIGTLKAPPHRLQLIPSSGGVRVIDDAFNSNPAGFAMAMEVLAAFPPRRILVTPGLVSLGSEEEMANAEAGRVAATAADVVVLVGPRKTQPVRQGLLSAGFPEQSIYSVHSLAEVTKLMQTLLAPGDTVLFENDLPDTYNE